MTENRTLLTYTAFDDIEPELLQWLGSLQTNMSEAVILAPSKDAADQIAFRLCAIQSGSFGLHRFSLAKLAGVLATEELARSERLPMSALGAEAIASRCVFRANATRRKKLSYFKPVAEMPGFARALARTFVDLRLERVDRESLASSGLAGQDLAQLVELFEQEMDSQSLSDLALLYQLATETITRNPENGTAAENNRLLGLPVLLVDVIPRSRAELQFCRAILDRSPRVLASLQTQDSHAIEIFEALLDTQGTPVAHASKMDSLRRIQRTLFREENKSSGNGKGLESAPPPPPKPDDNDSSFEFFSAPGEGRECVEIARRILQCATAGIPFDQMAVLLRNPDLYQPQLEEAFRRTAIAAYFSRGTVRPDPTGRAYLTLLSCALEQLSASRFAEYLSFGQVPPLDEKGRPTVKISWVQPADELQLTFKTALSREAPAEEEAEPESLETETSRVVAGTLRTPRHWEKLLVDAAVIGGRDRWARRLHGLEAELKLKAQESEDPNRKKRFLGELDKLKNLEDFALPVIEFLGELPKEAKWGQWLEHLRRLAAMSLTKPESVLAVLAELQPMANVGPVSLQEIQMVLTERLSFLRSDPPERPYGRVFVGSTMEAAGRSFEIVFLPGLAEGIFPKKVQEDPLLLDQDRRNLSTRSEPDSGQLDRPRTHLSTREDRIHRERQLLHLAAASARRRFIVSYPRIDVSQGRGRVPSLYALELLRTSEGSLPALQKLEQKASAGSATHLGWPAPQSSDEAIDAAEYDLSILDPLLTQNPADVTGKGRFLLDVNPFLATSLRARYRRWQNVWSYDDGLVIPKDPEVKKILDQQRPIHRSYSPTALQNYSACPYRFFLSGIQRLQPREESVAIEQMDPLTRGGLFHALQFELLQTLQREQLLPVLPERVDAVMTVADRVLDQVAADYRETLAPAIPSVWQGEVEDLRVDLRAWIRDVAQRDGDWTPAHFEYSFGLPLSEGHDVQSTEEVAIIMGRFRIRGIIDLIELSESRGELRITDHKTGRVPWPRPKITGKGEILQPLLYSLAAEALLRRPVSSGRLYYCTQRGNYQQLHFHMNDQSLFHLKEVLETIDRSIEIGFLPAAPRANACRFCDYQAVCGPYEEIRTARKQDGFLNPLASIRAIP